MKGIYLYMTMCAAAITFAACTNELEENTLPTDALVLTVGDYPAFSEGANTRAVGTFDPGKTAWANGDKVLVSVSSNGSTTQYATLTYESDNWTPSQTLTRPTGNYTVNAWYAPAYEWGTNNTLTLISDGQAGTDEFLTTTSTTSNIDFSNATRNYSRLRFVSSTNTSLTVTLSNFTPAGGNATNNYRATLTTDSKGNAYLYGSWNASTSLTVKALYLDSDISKNLSSASAASKSYAVDTPKMISSIPDDWQGSTTDITGYYKLTQDIMLPSGDWTAIGGSATNLREEGRFRGTLDGGGHTISGLSGSCRGLFNAIYGDGVVRNLTINNCNINNSSSDFVGAIAGINAGHIENCHVTGNITGGENVGGIVGYNTSSGGNGTIVACSNSASITGSQYVGGIVGDNRQVILSCTNSGTITGAGGAITSGGNTTSCYFSVGTDNGIGTQITNNDWSSAIENMNNALQSAGYDYQWTLQNGMPVIENN